MPLTSFYSALSGLNNSALAINVIGNNLANMNTTAFKTSKTSFAELLGGFGGTGIDGNPLQVGLGATVAGITQILTQGSVAYTGRATDAAINGNGYFVVETPEGGQGFTRAGNFGLSSTGELVNSLGFKVLGYRAVDGAIDSSGGLSPVVIQSSASMPPKATTKIDFGANLDSQAAPGSTYATSIQVYDSLGAAHTVTLTFTKTNPQPATGSAWSWSATLPSTDFTTPPAGPPVGQIGSGSVTFDSAGVLTAGNTNGALTITGLADGATDMDGGIGNLPAINFNIFDANGNPRLTGYASASTVSSSSQDGYASSQLLGFAIDSNGVISGSFNNGQSQPLAQLAVAIFPNAEGLQKFKDGTAVSFTSSGDPSIGTAGTGGRGTISGSALEQSNVDIAQEFTNLIVAQRGYQANSRIITTTDELYQDAINIKR
jgi:flagellar hook protein FlgE